MTFIGYEIQPIKITSLSEPRSKVYSKVAHLLSFSFRKNKIAFASRTVKVNPFNFLFLSKTRRLAESVYKTPRVMNCSIRVDYYCLDDLSRKRVA